MPVIKRPSILNTYLSFFLLGLCSMLIHSVINLESYIFLRLFGNTVYDAQGTCFFLRRFHYLIGIVVFIICIISNYYNCSRSILLLSAGYFFNALYMYLISNGFLAITRFTAISILILSVISHFLLTSSISYLLDPSTYNNDNSLRVTLLICGCFASGPFLKLTLGIIANPFLPIEELNSAVQLFCRISVAFAIISAISCISINNTINEISLSNEHISSFDEYAPQLQSNPFLGRSSDKPTIRIDSETSFSRVLWIAIFSMFSMSYTPMYNNFAFVITSFDTFDSFNLGYFHYYISLLTGTIVFILIYNEYWVYEKTPEDFSSHCIFDESPDVLYSSICSRLLRPIQPWTCLPYNSTYTKWEELDNLDNSTLYSLLHMFYGEEEDLSCYYEESHMKYNSRKSTLLRLFSDYINHCQEICKGLGGGTGSCNGGSTVKTPQSSKSGCPLQSLKTRLCIIRCGVFKDLENLISTSCVHCSGDISTKFIQHTLEHCKDQVNTMILSLNNMPENAKYEDANPLIKKFILKLITLIVYKRLVVEFLLLRDNMHKIINNVMGFNHALVCSCINNDKRCSNGDKCVCTIFCKLCKSVILLHERYCEIINVINGNSDKDLSTVIPSLSLTRSAILLTTHFKDYINSTCTNETSACSCGSSKYQKPTIIGAVTNYVFEVAITLLGKLTASEKTWGLCSCHKYSSKLDDVTTLLLGALENLDDSDGLLTDVILLISPVVSYDKLNCKVVKKERGRRYVAWVKCCKNIVDSRTDIDSTVGSANGCTAEKGENSCSNAQSSALNCNSSCQSCRNGDVGKCCCFFKDCENCCKYADTTIDTCLKTIIGQFNTTGTESVNCNLICYLCCIKNKLDTLKNVCTNCTSVSTVIGSLSTNICNITDKICKDCCTNGQCCSTDGNCNADCKCCKVNERYSDFTKYLLGMNGTTGETSDTCNCKTISKSLESLHDKLKKFTDCSTGNGSETPCKCCCCDEQCKDKCCCGTTNCTCLCKNSSTNNIKKLSCIVECGLKCISTRSCEVSNHIGCVIKMLCCINKKICELNNKYSNLHECISGLKDCVTNGTACIDNKINCLKGLKEGNQKNYKTVLEKSRELIKEVCCLYKTQCSHTSCLYTNFSSLTNLVKTVSDTANKVSSSSSVFNKLLSGLRYDVFSNPVTLVYHMLRNRFFSNESDEIDLGFMYYIPVVALKMLLFVCRNYRLLPFIRNYNSYYIYRLLAIVFVVVVTFLILNCLCMLSVYRNSGYLVNCAILIGMICSLFHSFFSQWFNYRIFLYNRFKELHLKFRLLYPSSPFKNEPGFFWWFEGFTGFLLNDLTTTYSLITLGDLSTGSDPFSLGFTTKFNSSNIANDLLTFSSDDCKVKTFNTHINTEDDVLTKLAKSMVGCTDLTTLLNYRSFFHIPKSEFGILSSDSSIYHVQLLWSAWINGKVITPYTDQLLSIKEKALKNVEKVAQDYVKLNEYNDESVKRLKLYFDFQEMIVLRESNNWHIPEACVPRADDGNSDDNIGGTAVPNVNIKGKISEAQFHNPRKMKNLSHSVIDINLTAAQVKKMVILYSAKYTHEWNKYLSKNSIMNHSSKNDVKGTPNSAGHSLNGSARGTSENPPNAHNGAEESKKHGSAEGVFEATEELLNALNIWKEERLKYCTEVYKSSICEKVILRTVGEFEDTLADHTPTEALDMYSQLVCKSKLSDRVPADIMIAKFTDNQDSKGARRDISEIMKSYDPSAGKFTRSITDGYKMTSIANAHEDEIGDNIEKYTRHIVGEWIRWQGMPVTHETIEILTKMYSF